MKIVLLIVLTVSLYSSELSKYLKFNNNATLSQVKNIFKKEQLINGDENDIESPLYFAADLGNVHIVKYLISVGANVNEMKSLGTPLHVAGHRGHYKIAKILLENGANPHILNSMNVDVFSVVHESNLKQLLFKYKKPNDKATQSKYFNDGFDYPFRNYKDFNVANAIAKRENKFLLLFHLSAYGDDVYSDTFYRMLKQPEVAKILDKEFIVVTNDTLHDKYIHSVPKSMRTYQVPTTMVIKDGKLAFQPIVGTIDKHYMLYLLKQLSH